MAKETQTRRPPRIAVPNNEQAIVRAGRERVVGILCKLSVTGGAIRFAKRFTPGVLADITLRTTSGQISSAIQFLCTHTGAPDVQAFRFVHMDPLERRQLETVIDQMRQQGFGEKRRGLLPFVEMAQRAFSSARRKMATFS